MKRIVIILAAFALLLCACSDGNPNPRVRTVTKVPGSADTALPRQIVFAIDSGADNILISAAENFCRNVNSLSKGAYILTLAYSSDPLEQLKSGHAGLILLDGDKAALLHPYFSIANERFRYSGYENFSMACNAARVLSKLSDVSGTRVFAAYYTGSDVLGGIASLDETLAVDRNAAPDTPPREVGLSTIPGSGTNAAFNLPGITATEIGDVDDRMKMLHLNDNLAELSFPELLPSTIAASTPLPAAEKESVVITRTFHSITPTWLILAPSFYDTLSPVGRAAVDEAAAYMTNNIDGAYLRLEQERFDALEENGIQISGEFSSTRMKILRARDELPDEVSVEEKYFRELLGRI